MSFLGVFIFLLLQRIPFLNIMIFFAQSCTNVEDKFFMGEVNIHNEEEEEGDEVRDEESEEESKYNSNISPDYSVESAVPPNDFDSPYSRLPKNVPLSRVKKNVCDSLKFNEKSKFSKLFDLEHIDAIISDSFWYVICKVFKPDQYIDHEELFLDRIAANYVSFTLHDEFMCDSSESSKKKDKKSTNNFYKKLNMKDAFFNNFYNAIAQSIFCCLFFAYPKSRSKLNDEIKRELLDIFSMLFTGTQIKSASFDHWNIEIGTSNVLSGGQKSKKKDDRPLSLADVNQMFSGADGGKKGGKSLKTKREIVPMKYSPLVERYLNAHKYETMNNVREWKMLLTERTKMQKMIDEKFAKYQIIAQQVVDEKDSLEKEYKLFTDEINKKKAKSEAETKRHIEMLKRKDKELIENGCSEYANMLVSIFNYQFGGNADEF